MRRRLQTGIILSLCQAVLAGLTASVLSAGEPASGDGMVLVPAGEFLMGSLEKDGLIGQSIGVDEIPQHSVYLKAYYIDRYEVTIRQFKAFVDATSWKGNMPPDENEDIPVTGVSWYDADAFCLWAGKRLPTEAEWEKAARGADGRQWPWGSDHGKDKCNTRYTGAGKILPPGSVSGDISPFGVYDMCGNVGEWTSSWYLPYSGSDLKRDSFGEVYKVTRGGSFVMPAMPYSRSAYRANTYKPDFRHRGVGFRCVRDDGTE